MVLGMWDLVSSSWKQLITIAAVTALSACATDKAFLDTTAAIVPAGSGLDICSGYAAGWGCDGGSYYVHTPDGRIIRRHEGMDFHAPAGAPVISATRGRISSYSTGLCGGIVVVMSDIVATNPKTGKPGPLLARYVHLEPAASLRLDGRIEAGDVIGHIQDPNAIKGKDRCVGSVPHVHFALRFTDFRIGQHINPNLFWANGPGMVTCYREGMAVPRGKAVAPLRCRE